MLKWWSIRNREERRRAKEADERKRAERDRLIELSGGTIQEIVLDGVTGWASPRGAFWPFASKAERRIARQFAQAGLFPSPLLEIIMEADGSSVSLRGRSGTVYPCDVSSGFVLRPHFRAALKVEKRYRL
jgi:hypothetical protein